MNKKKGILGFLKELTTPTTDQKSTGNRQIVLLNL